MASQPSQTKEEEDDEEDQDFLPDEEHHSDVDEQDLAPDAIERSVENLQQHRVVTRSGARQRTEQETVAHKDSSENVEAKERAAKLWAEMKNSSVTPQLPDSKAMAPHPQEKTVTEICNFAGQAVVVTKTVSVSNVPTKKPTIPGKEPVQKLPQKTGAAVSLPTKRPSSVALQDILNPKRRKLTTLDKSKLDWQQYCTDKGLNDTLQQQRKSGTGFIDKSKFLEKTDWRQYEQERDLRMKELQKKLP